MAKLLVIVPDAISYILAKGEYQPRYYNPGNLFDEVHIMMTNDDQVDPRDLQLTVGDAHLFVHNLPIEGSDPIRNSPFFRPWLLKPWAKPFLGFAKHQILRIIEKMASPAIDLARRIKPNLIRCHGNDYNAVVALEIKKQLGIPYLVSLHINPDINPRRRRLNSTNWQDQLYSIYFDNLEKVGLLGADLALPVYSPIIPYLERIGCTRYEVAYNVLSSHLQKKADYKLHHPIRLISVGRHFGLKNPENIIRAVKHLPQVHLTLVGDGSLQEYLVSLVRELGLQERVIFEPSLPNIELCYKLPDYDIFIIHSEHWEISKALLEALLTGMPVIINHREGKGGDAQELKDDFLLFTQNTPEDYLRAIQQLISSDKLREELGRKAFAHAQKSWAPEKTEAKYVEIYQRIIKSKKG